MMEGGIIIKHWDYHKYSEIRFDRLNKDTYQEKEDNNTKQINKSIN